MSEDLKPAGAEDPAVIRKPIVVPVDTETDDGIRPVTKDRLPGDIGTAAPAAVADVVRQPINLSTAMQTSDDGTRSVTKDRLPGDIVADAADDTPPVVRKPIDIEPQADV